MAKQDDKSDRSTRRVYKSSDVHKRRVGDSARSKPAKMPSKREVRESARESTRIAAESRIDRVEKAEPAVDESVEDRLPAAEATPAEKPKPRFTVIKGAGSKTRDDRVISDQSDVSDDAADFPVEKRPQRATGDEAPSPRENARAASTVEPTSPEKDDGEDEQRAGRANNDRPKRRLTADAREAAARVRPRTVVITVVMVLAIVAVVLFAYNRWGRYDDHVDLQGTWYVVGTEVPITIDAETIRFNEEVSYNYEINPREKTISYTFGPMAGQGRYWFSEDRKHLVITDGDGYTAAGTTVDDLVHSFLDFSTATGGGVVELPQGEGIIAFSRTPEALVVNQPADELVEPSSDESQSASAAENPETVQQTEEDEVVEEEETVEEPTNEEEAA